MLAESATLSHEASREGEGRSTYPMRMGKVSANLSLTGLRVPEGETSRGESREGEGHSTYPMRMGKVSANLSLTGAGGRDLARRHLEGKTSFRW